MKVVALAGGVGAGKFLRGLDRELPGVLDTVIVNTGDDLEVYGLHVSPDIDSVCYWLSGMADRERGWGVSDETFRAMEEVSRNPSADAWFNLGDRDMAVHLFRTEQLRGGLPLSAVTLALARGRFELSPKILPMSDDPVTTRIEVLSEGGESVDLHFQVYWVKRRAEDPVKGIRYEGVERARPAPGVMESIEEADAVVISPSNPVASIGPILALQEIRAAVGRRRSRVVGVSPIVGGAPLAGMADKLMPVVGLEVSALGAARAYEGLLAGWVIDEVDRDLAPKIAAELGVRVAVTDTIMRDDATAGALARTALGLLS